MVSRRVERLTSSLIRDVLAEGALAKLMMMPNKPWTDIQNGADRRTKFEVGIANARASAVSALGSAPQRVTAQH